MLATSGSSGRHARVSGRRGTARLAAGALAAAALLSGLAVTGFAGVASATPGPIILYATPGGQANGTATGACTSATSNPCSLSGAITAAGSLNGAAVTIELEHSNGALCSASGPCAFSGTQSVSSGSEVRLTIEGTGTGSGSSAYSVLDAGVPGTTFTDSATFPVKLSNVTVTGGSAYSVLDGGGPRYHRGGGIYNTSAALTVVDSTISGNTTGDSGGGGIYNTGTVSVVDSTISGNFATSGGSGGGIFNAAGTVSVVDSTISGNTTGDSGGGGGGIYNTGTVSVVDSTISGNAATASGARAGGIYNAAGIASVVDSTISGNAAAWGDGFYGSGILAGSIVAGNSGSPSNCSIRVTDAGYNLSSDTSCFGSTPSGNGSISNASLDLGTLGNYGGPTETVPLGFGSAAASAISGQATVTLGGATYDLCGGSATPSENAYAGANLDRDQRGVWRPSTGCSAGAYQAYQYVPPPPPPTSTTTALSSSVNPSSVGQQVTYTATVSPVPEGGTVGFTDGGTTISGCGSVAVSTTTGQATCSVTYSVASTHTIVATYSGDATFASSTSPPLSQTVQAALTPTSTSVSVAPSSVSEGQSVSYSASVSTSSGAPTGTVAFTTGSTSLCTATLSSGTGSCSASNAPAGTDTVTGTYSGDSTHAASSGTATLTVSLPPPPQTTGYWEVAADGGIFAFHAPFYGSMSGKALNKSVVGIAADPATGGYWEVAADGGVFAFNAPFYGSMSGKALNKPVVGIAATT